MAPSAHFLLLDRPLPKEPVVSLFIPHASTTILGSPASWHPTWTNLRTDEELESLSTVTAWEVSESYHRATTLH